MNNIEPVISEEARTMWTQKKYLQRLWISLIVVWFCGCGPTPPPATDKSQAIDVLRTTLEAWQAGEKPETLKARTPAIQVVDPAWSQGIKLTRFEIEAEQAGPSGYDVGCPVKLWLADGKKEPRRVKFTIATNPVIVVTRDFGG